MIGNCLELFSWRIPNLFIPFLSLYDGHTRRALAKFYSAIGRDALVGSNIASNSSRHPNNSSLQPVSQRPDTRANRNEGIGGTGSIFRSGWGEFLRPKIVKQDSNEAFAAEVQDEVMFQGGSGQFALGYTMFPANATTAGESNNGSGANEISQERVAAMAKRFNVSEDEVRAHMTRKHGTPASPASPTSSSGATPIASSPVSTPTKSNSNTTSSSSSSPPKSPHPTNQSPTSNTLNSSRSNDVTLKTESGKKKTTLFHRTVQKLFKSKSSDSGGDTGTSSSCVPSAEALNAVVSSPQLIRKAMLSSMMLRGKDAANLDENKHGSKVGEWVTFGHGGVGGSIALCSVHPDGRTIAIAVTLNRLSFNPSSTSGRLVAHVYKKFGISVPNNFR